MEARREFIKKIIAGLGIGALLTLRPGKALAASGATLCRFIATDKDPLAAAFAIIDYRNNHPVLDFDGATDEEAVFTDILPRNYSGGGVTVDLMVGFTSATSGTSRWQVAFERIDSAGLDIDADSFAAFQSNGLSAPATSGVFTKVSITFTNGAQMDSVVAGDWFRLKIRRDADGTSGTDDITTDAELMGVEIRET